MPIFEQVILTPGRYHIGHGRYKDLTKQDLEEYVQGTQEILDAGIDISVPSEHPLPLSAEGSPVESHDEAPQFADAIKNAGWLRGIRINSDGAVTAQYDITSEAYAKAIREKSIKYSSPELREEWESGTGKRFKRHFSHFALTPKPRNDEQEPLEECAQFSLTELDATKSTRSEIKGLLKNLGVNTPSSVKHLGLKDEELEDTATLLTQAVALNGMQFAEVTDPKDQNKDSMNEGSNPSSTSDNSNPDMPPAANNGDMNAAIIAHLSELGVELPSDYDLANDDFKVLLAALKTASAAKRKHEEDEQKEERTPTQIEEEPMPAGSQFSDEAQAVIEQQRAQLAAYHKERLDSTVTSCRVPGIAKALKERLDTVQFSESGEEEPTLTVSQVVELVNAAIPEALTFSDDGVAEASPPEGMSETTDEEIDAWADGFLGRTGYAKAVQAAK